MGPPGSQHRLFNEHLVSASSNPALALRRKKHTEKEVPADLVSTVSVRLREGYSVREVTLAKGKSHYTLLQFHRFLVTYMCADLLDKGGHLHTTHLSVPMRDSACHLRQMGFEVLSRLSTLCT